MDSAGIFFFAEFVKSRNFKRSSKFKLRLCGRINH